MDAGLLLLRVVVGVALVGHGTQKLFGWFGGLGRHRTGAFFELLGYRPGVVFAVVAGLSEAGGGASLAFGFLTPLAGAAIVGVMLNAACCTARARPVGHQRRLGVPRRPGHRRRNHRAGRTWIRLRRPRPRTRLDDGMGSRRRDTRRRSSARHTAVAASACHAHVGSRWATCTRRRGGVDARPTRPSSGRPSSGRRRARRAAGGRRPAPHRRHDHRVRRFDAVRLHPRGPASRAGCCSSNQTRGQSSR